MSFHVNPRTMKKVMRVHFLGGGCMEKYRNMCIFL